MVARIAVFVFTLAPRRLFLAPPDHLENLAHGFGHARIFPTRKKVMRHDVELRLRWSGEALPQEGQPSLATTKPAMQRHPGFFFFLDWRQVDFSEKNRYITHMPTISIPKELLKEKELVLVPRRKYERLLDMEKFAQKRLAEESAVDKAVKVYKREKRLGRLKPIKTLAELY